MGLFERGPVGNVDVGERRREARSRSEVFTRLAVSVVILGLWTFFVILRMGAMFRGIAGAIAYLFLAYLLHPEADDTNLGWFGGLVNNPFRFSDNVNRFLLFLKVVLLPGRFISESLVDAAGIVARQS